MAPKKASGLKGQRPITGFFVNKSLTPASASAAAAAGQPGGRDDEVIDVTADACASPPPAKKQRTQKAPRDSAAAEATSVPTVTPAAAAAPAAAPRAPRAPASNNTRADARQGLQEKLGLTGGVPSSGSGNGGGGASGAGQTKAASAAAPAAAGAKQQGPIEPAYVTDPSTPITAQERGKLTPLETQVVDLKRAHPGVLLLIEVGYKMKFYGADAEAASRILGIYSYQDRHFLTASVPMPRLHFHVRRLVLAGNKVGIVRQVETAAIKKAGDNKSGPFGRRLTALYTRSTLEAGEMGGLCDTAGDEEDEEQEEGAAGPSTATAAGAGSNGGAAASRLLARRARDAALLQDQQSSSYLVCCVEQPVGGGSGGGGGGGVGEGPQAVEVGLVAVESSTGAVLHAQFRDGLMRQELEGRLLFARPAELLLAEPASVETRRLCENLGEALGSAPRLEMAPAGKYGSGSSGRGGAGGSGSGSGGGTSSALAAVLAFYGAETEASGEEDGEDEGGNGGAAVGAATPASAAAGGSGAPVRASPAALAAVRALPPLVLRALAHLLDYLRPFNLESVLRLGASFQPWATAQEMRLSANTLRQLEIFGNSGDGGKKGSLLSILDHTQTAMGRRLLHSWVGKPLRQRESIIARQDAVQELTEQGDSHPVLSCLRPALKKLGLDLERGITRAFHGTIRPSDFAALLHQFQRLHEQLGVQADLSADPATAGNDGTAFMGGSAGEANLAAGTAGSTPPGDGGGTMGGSGAGSPPLQLQGVQSVLLRQLLRAAADPQVAAAARQLLASMDLTAAAANDRQNVLKEDEERFPEVQRWRGEVAGAERHLAALLAQFRRQLQLSNLQYISLQNQGEYLLEVPHDLIKARVPKGWEKVSSVKKGVRFRPPEVKEGLAQLELSREHLQAACTAAWRQFLRSFADLYLPFRASVQALAALDCLAGLAVLASSHGYCRPELLGDDAPPTLHIEGGRHPMLELMLEGQGKPFVPNDIHLQGDGRRCAVITGPNMGGKSCFSRQCALISIMAQVGSYVPAQAARLRTLDGVFCRMGASDNLALGRSTFAEELGETSAILASATSSSLVILDELGRGTSTGDGAAIAEACVQHVVAGQGAPHPLALFITHYPEVCFRLQAALPQAVTCYRMAHAEEEEGPPAPTAGTAGGTAGGATTAGTAAGGAGPAAAAATETTARAAGPHADAVAGAGAGEAQPAALGRIVFLFKLVEGVAPASFGLNVARMAQLPAVVIQRAADVAARVQAEAERRRPGAQQAQQEGQQAEAGGGGGIGGGSSGDQAEAEVVELARQCRQFLAAVLAGGGPVDAEAGRQLQQRARQLLAVAADGA